MTTMKNCDGSKSGHCGDYPNKSENCIAIFASKKKIGMAVPLVSTK
jgi:hypothetical protein